MADLKEVKSKALSFLDSKGKTIDLKAEQEKALYSLLEGNDVLAVLPTGFGITMIFTMFSVAARERTLQAPVSHFIYASAEKVLEERFLRALKDFSSELLKRISLIVVDESHTVETWTATRRRLQGKLPITE